MVRCLLFI